MAGIYKTWASVRYIREKEMKTEREKLALRKKMLEDEKAFEEEAKKVREDYLEWYMARITLMKLIDERLKRNLCLKLSKIAAEAQANK